MFALAPTAMVASDQSFGDRSDARAHFRPDIEGLRAVAVIAVLLFHVGLPGVPGGFIGVDVFYVISGFLITGLLVRELRATSTVDLVTFYARRLRRLLPAALVVIGVTLVASWAVLSRLRFPEVAGDAAASALYVSNLRFAEQATDYLAAHESPSPYLHFWSLAVEEQFYLFWPLLLLVGARLLSLARLGLLLALVALGSFGLSLVWTDTEAPWAFFSLPTRAWELAVGALIAVGALRLPRRSPEPLAIGLVTAGLGLIVIACVVIDDSTPYPGMAALLPVVGTALVIIGGSATSAGPSRWLSASVPRWLGRISYSLYLWHWPILVLVPIAIGIDSLGLRLGLAAVAIADRRGEHGGHRDPDPARAGPAGGRRAKPRDGRDVLGRDGRDRGRRGDRCPVASLEPGQRGPGERARKGRRTCGALPAVGRSDRRTRRPPPSR